MGVRGELFSTKVILQNRTYFFNVKENRLGDLYLNIVESKNRDEGGFERQSVILFAEDLTEFLRGFDESLKVLEKAVREKRRGKDTPSYAREINKDNSRSYPPRGRDNRNDRDFEKGEGNRRPRSPRPERKGDRTQSRGPRRDRPDKRESGPRSTGYRSEGHRSEGYRSEGKPDSFPRKKKVVVRKK